ncbi:band 3 anion transport protein isoform X1 [Folsomia candida]|uniref:band 3 anion transport protein isoform X1 n=1 Tax=Folsomia candida TaxID=158441 RepID=UPI001605574C|nr:band 3 anion transport protein isoform X1 [Folsomia candida]XP_035714634.1 band 3 anion transport protein isoform X1 [Folsomia candida]
MHPSQNPRKKKDNPPPPSVRRYHAPSPPRLLSTTGSTTLEEMIDEVLLGHDGEIRDDQGFQLEALLNSPPPSSADLRRPTAELRRFDERDYQSHRRESFPHTHQPLRHHAHVQRRRTTSSSTTTTTTTTKGSDTTATGTNFKLEAFVSRPVFGSPVPFVHDLSGRTNSPPKKVQFEIGGASLLNQEEQQQSHEEKKKHKKHHHHHHSHGRRLNGSDRFAQPELEAGMDDLDQENLSTHRFTDNKGYQRHKISSKFSDDLLDTSAAMSLKPVRYDHQPHEIFVELDVLSGQGEHRQWKEAARWIKYEEDVLEGSDRWGRPHVASLSFHSLINLRQLIESGVTLLDLQERDLPGVAYRAVEAFVLKELIRPEEKAFVMRNILLKHKHVNENDSPWKFNLRRNTTANGSLTSLHAMMEQDKLRHNHHRALMASPNSNTVPDGLVNGAGGGMVAAVAGKMARRNSAASRLTCQDYQQEDLHHERILIDEDSAISPLSTHPSDDLMTQLSLNNMTEEDVKWVLNKENLLRRIPVGAEASIVLVGKDDKLERPIMAFIRLAESSYMPNITEVPIPVRFIYVVLGPSSFDLDYKEIGRSISTLMSNTHFHEIAYKAHDRRDMLKGIHDFLDESIVLPPGDWDNELFPFEEMKEKRDALRRRKESKRRQSSIRTQGVGLLEDDKGAEGCGFGEPPEDHRRPSKDHHDNPFKRTSRLFGGMMNDARRRYKRYWSDLKDGLNFQTLASVVFIYFACLSGAIAIGGILSDRTDKHIGISETLVATSVSGLIFSLMSGQPLVILGTTGPLLLFDESLYKICKQNDVDFLAFRFWIGLWVVMIGMFVVSFDGSVIARFFSRFVQEIFASLISIMFISEAIENIVKVYTDHPVQQSYGNRSAGSSPSPNTALLSTLLTFGTFGIAYTLRAARTSTYFTLGIRKFLGNFAVPIAIALMVGIDYSLMERATTKKLEVPDGLKNSKPRSSWMVDVSPIPWHMAFLAIVPATLVFILMFMETCICALIIGKKENKLQKGGGYHLDIFLICVINGGLACIGGCWVCAATVRAVAHASSLIVFSTNNPPGEKPSIVGVKEQRVSNFIISILVGLSVFVSPILMYIPMAVLFGVFLYMGISSMAGIQFFERCSLLFKQVNNHPQVPYVQRVKTSKMHLFTVIQVLCLATLLGVRQTSAALAIPFLLILLVPLRLFGLERLFKPSELQALDESGEDVPEDDNSSCGKRMSMDKLPLNVNSDNLTFSDDLYKEEQASATLNFIDLGMTVDPPNKPSNGVVQQNGMQNNTKE